MNQPGGQQQMPMMGGATPMQNGMQNGMMGGATMMGGANMGGANMGGANMGGANMMGGANVGMMGVPAGTNMMGQGMQVRKGWDCYVAWFLLYNFFLFFLIFVFISYNINNTFRGEVNC